MQASRGALDWVRIRMPIYKGVSEQMHSAHNGYNKMWPEAVDAPGGMYLHYTGRHGMKYKFIPGVSVDLYLPSESEHQEMWAAHEKAHRESIVDWGCGCRH